MLFGTFYMPKDELPDVYGINDKLFPEGFGARSRADLRIAARQRSLHFVHLFAVNLKNGPPAVAPAGGVVCA